MQVSYGPLHFISTPPLVIRFKGGCAKCRIPRGSFVGAFDPYLLNISSFFVSKQISTDFINRGRGEARVEKNGMTLLKKCWLHSHNLFKNLQLIEVAGT